MSNESGMIRLSDLGHLYRCRACSLIFRHPFLSSSELIEQYSSTPPDLWLGKQRPDFALALQTIINTFSSCRVLDIGCYRGDFLQMLPSQYERYGVEPSNSVTQSFAKHQIKLIGSTIDEIEMSKPMFHVITLFDLIEHLPHPLASLHNARKLLLPGGLLILSTGNTDALPWRLMRLEYWYYFTEHVSFFNRKWFNWASKHLDLEISVYQKFSHFEGSAIERWSQFVRCLAYLIMGHNRKDSRILDLLAHIYPFSNVRNWSSPPRTLSWRDHIFVVLTTAS